MTIIIWNSKLDLTKIEAWPRSPLFLRPLKPFHVLLLLKWTLLLLQWRAQSSNMTLGFSLPCIDHNSKRDLTPPNPDLYRWKDSQGQRTQARDRRNSLFPSQDRYRESRSHPSESSNRITPQTFPPRQEPPRTQNRPYSSDRNQRPDQQRLPDRRPSYTPDRYEHSYSSDRNQRPPDRNRSYSRDRNLTWSRDNRDQERNCNRSYSRDRYSNYNQGRSREPSYKKNQNSDMERQRYQQSVYDRNQRNLDREREQDRQQQIRYWPDSNQPPYRSPSPYPVKLRNRRDQRDGYTPRSTSLTWYEDISPTAKMLTVNVNGSKFDRPSLKN